MKKLKILLIISIIGLLIIGCSGKVAKIKEQLDLGSKYMAELDYENAIIALNKAIEIDPKNVDAYAMLAKVYEKSGRPDEAKSTLEKALEIENLSSEKTAEINEEIEGLQYLVKISQIPKEYDEPLSIELSNTKSLKIFYTIETENSEMSIVDGEYTNPIILDKNGTYIITTYTMDENDVKYDEAKVKYTIKLKSISNNNSSSEAKSEENKSEISKGWKQVGEDWYYYGDTGKPVNGEQVIDDKSYYFDDEGKLIRNQFVREEIDASEKDDIYYLMSGGGMVFGGGEPLLHSKFIHKICTLADGRWARRIETSLNVPWDYIKPVLYDMDEWIIDIKDINDDIYKKYTGISNQNMRKNLLRLGNKISTEKIHIRVPKISGYNCAYDVEKSVEWIRENMSIEPEVFEYKKI